MLTSIIYPTPLPLTDEETIQIERCSKELYSLKPHPMGLFTGSDNICFSNNIGKILRLSHIDPLFSHQSLTPSGNIQIDQTVLIRVITYVHRDLEPLRSLLKYFDLNILSINMLKFSFNTLIYHATPALRYDYIPGYLNSFLNIFTAYVLIHNKIPSTIENLHPRGSAERNWELIKFLTEAIENKKLQPLMQDVVKKEDTIEKERNSVSFMNELGATFNELWLTRILWAFYCDFTPEELNRTIAKILNI